MTSRDDGPGLFYLALLLVALVAFFIVGKLLFGQPKRRSPRLWALVLAGMVPPCTTPPVLEWRSEGSAGWSSPYMPGHLFNGRHQFQIA